MIVDRELHPMVAMDRLLRQIGTLGLCQCGSTRHLHGSDPCLNQGRVVRSNDRGAFVFCWLCNDHAPDADPPAFPRAGFRAPGDTRLA